MAALVGGRFQRAQREQKLILLDLGTPWCHWCHVMEEQTYADPAVADLLSRKYLALNVDADSRPDLANRYEEYGWPATIIFKGDGTELARRRGFIPPKAMASMLQAFIDDPTPGPSIEPERIPDAAVEARLSSPQRTALRARLIDAYDTRHGGWARASITWTGTRWSIASPRAPPVMRASPRWRGRR